MKVNITGDFYIQKNTSYYFDSHIKSAIEDCDLMITNLEAPITLSKNKSNKTGPHLKHGFDISDTLNILKINLVTLANNHIYDYCIEGITETIENLNKNQIEYVGVDLDGLNIGNYKIVEDDKKKIGIINICENEWVRTQDSKQGGCNFNILENTKLILDLKKRVDKIILIYHGGNEYYNLPSPRIKELFHFFCDIGVDYLVSHHTHVFSGYEIYNNSKIFYGLGNFIFDYNSNYIGAILNIDTKKDLFKITLFNFDNKTKKLTLNTMAIQELNILNEIILDNEKLECSWINFINTRTSYLFKLNIYSIISNKYFDFIISKVKVLGFLISKKRLMYVMNLIRCESHRDLLITLLKNKVK